MSNVTSFALLQTNRNVKETITYLSEFADNLEEIHTSGEMNRPSLLHLAKGIRDEIAVVKEVGEQHSETDKTPGRYDWTKLTFAGIGEPPDAEIIITLFNTLSPTKETWDNNLDNWKLSTFHSKPITEQSIPFVGSSEAEVIDTFIAFAKEQELPTTNNHTPILITANALIAMTENGYRLSGTVTDGGKITFVMVNDVEQVDIMFDFDLLKTIKKNVEKWSGGLDNLTD